MIDLGEGCKPRQKKPVKRRIRISASHGDARESRVANRAFARNAKETLPGWATAGK
jgi:hypothetical protein